MPFTSGVPNLRKVESLGFLGFTFRFDLDRPGRNWTYLNIFLGGWSNYFGHGPAAKRRPVIPVKSTRC